MRAVLTITIDYDDAEEPDENDIEDHLLDAANHLANNGLLAPIDQIVDTWMAEVEFNGGGK